MTQLKFYVRELYIFTCIKKYHQKAIPSQSGNKKRKQICSLPRVLRAHCNFLAFLELKIVLIASFEKKFNLAMQYVSGEKPCFIFAKRI